MLSSHGQPGPLGGLSPGLSALFHSPPGPGPAPSCVLWLFTHFVMTECLGVRTITSLRLTDEETSAQGGKPCPRDSPLGLWGSPAAGLLSDEHLEHRPHLPEKKKPGQETGVQALTSAYLDSSIVAQGSGAWEGRQGLGTEAAVAAHGGLLKAYHSLRLPLPPAKKMPGSFSWPAQPCLSVSVLLPLPPTPAILGFFQTYFLHVSAPPGHRALTHAISAGWNSSCRYLST